MKCRGAFFAAGWLCFLLSALASAYPQQAIVINRPTSPRLLVDVGMPESKGRISRVSTAKDLQNAIDRATGGDQIVIDAGSTITGNFVLRNKQRSNGFVVIRSSGNIPPSGNRVAPSDAGAMARIQTDNSAPVFTTELGAHNYRLIGLEITKVPERSGSHRDLSYGLVWIGGPAPGTDKYPSQTLQLPHHIIIDRCYIHGDYGAPHGETYRGVMLHGDNVAVIDSYVANIHSEGMEVQAIEGGNSNGPIKIVNNYLEASGENIMFGGFDPSIPGLTTADIEIRHNLIAKPATWNPNSPEFKGVNYSVKNLFELKNAVRVLIDGNVLENNWVKAQNGTAILFTVRNQAGNCDWCAVQDVTFTNNIVRGTNHVFNIIGADGPNPNVSRKSWKTQQTQRILIANNLAYDIGGKLWNPNPSTGYGIFAAVAGGGAAKAPFVPIKDLIIQHNTAFPPYQVLSMALEPATDGFLFTDNVFTHGIYGIFGDGTGAGEVAIKKFVKRPQISNNLLVGASQLADNYPRSGFRWADSLAKVGFVNLDQCIDAPYNLDGCRIRKKGKPGVEPGVDVDRLKAATACVLSGKSCL